MPQDKIGVELGCDWVVEYSDLNIVTVETQAR